MSSNDSLLNSILSDIRNYEVQKEKAHYELEHYTRELEKVNRELTHYREKMNECDHKLSDLNRRAKQRQDEIDRAARL